MERHQRDLRIRRLAVACIYLLIIISLLSLFIVLKRQQREASPAKAPTVMVKNLVIVEDLVI
ncbi:MAG TPA: hypothetical protein VK666_29695 [Chryseolinea sp.]|nr:hypothetical protein [Chryseolinea sp.]